MASAKSWTESTAIDADLPPLLAAISTIPRHHSHIAPQAMPPQLAAIKNSGVFLYLNYASASRKAPRSASITGLFLFTKVISTIEKKPGSQCARSS
jgi:hypothetical protein